ncbi:MAG: nucleotidyltransferase family protein [Calditrichaeota bacterium]|nr:MAG: nucleotidyltransferase family protein [Calditrichota bacterium]
MKAVILAAGYATRMYPLTEHLPKPLLKIGRQTIIDHLLHRFLSFRALDGVYVVTNDKFAGLFYKWAIASKQLNAWPFDICVINDGTTSNDHRLGAIADVALTIRTQNLKDDVIVAAGDNIFQAEFRNMADFFAHQQADIVAAQHLDDIERLSQRGVVEVDDDLRVIGFEEKPAVPRSSLVCPALYIHRREHVPLYHVYLEEGNNPDAPGFFIKWLYTRIPVYAYVMNQPSIDIGTLEIYNRLLAELHTEKYIFLN